MFPKHNYFPGQQEVSLLLQSLLRKGSKLRFYFLLQFLIFWET
jgi:hypothetical protein